MKTTVYLSALCALFFGMACGGEPAPAPEPAPEAPCCTAAELIELHGQGLKDEAIVAKITEGAGPVLPRLRDAGVAEPVIQAWLEAAPEPEPTPAAEPEATADASTAAPPAEKPKSLPVTVRYEAEKNTFELINMGNSDITGITVLLNGEYKYTLPVPLKPGKPDTIRLASHRSTKTGDRMHDPAAPPFVKAVKIDKIVVRSNQGSWQKSF